MIAIAETPPLDPNLDPDRLSRRDFNRFLMGAVALGATPLINLLVLGDSLSAEYGLARGTGWVALMQDKLAREHPQVQVINASISGDTTAGGLSRLPHLLSVHKPNAVVIELGANDALQGLDIKVTQKNLDQMAQLVNLAHAKLVVVGTQVPPNYGVDYNRAFSQVFVKVAQDHRANLVPSLFSALSQHLASLPPTQANLDLWFQADHLHPLKEAHPFLLQAVWPAVQKTF